MAGKSSGPSTDPKIGNEISDGTGADALEDVQPQQDDHEHEGPQTEPVTGSTGAWSDGEQIPEADLEVPTPAVTTGDVDGFASDESAANGAPDETGLTNEQITYRRTADRTPGDPEGPTWPLDGRYRRVFTVEVPRVSAPADRIQVAWDDAQHEAMHNANLVATLQEALNKGLHPRGPARFDGVEGETIFDHFRQSGRESLVYSVEVVPASVELPAEAALAYTPSAAIQDFGGNTLPESESGE